MKRFIEWVLILGIGAYLIINKDLVVNFILDNFIVDTTVVKPTPNQYARNYDYINFDYDEDYVPHNKEDFKNILFNIFNSGTDSISFFCPKDYDECVDDLRSVTGNQLLITMINNYVNPFNSFSTINTKITTRGTTEEIHYDINRLYSEDDINEVNNKLNQIFNELNINNIQNSKDKILAFHDYLIKNVSYDSERAEKGDSNYKSNTAYGALIQGKAICSGYSDAMAIFLDRLGIPNYKISETAHIWNLVYIDGTWVHLDVTWDDTEYISGRHKFFLISTKKLAELDKTTHNFDKKFYLEANN